MPSVSEIDELMKRWSREWVPETSVDCQGEVFNVLWEASERYYGSNHYYSPKWVAATDAHVIETALKKCTAFKATSVRNATSNEPTLLPLTLPAAIARSNPKPQPGPATSVQPACTSSVGIAETSTVRSAIARS